MSKDDVDGQRHYLLNFSRRHDEILLKGKIDTRTDELRRWRIKRLVKRDRSRLISTMKPTYLGIYLPSSSPMKVTYVVLVNQELDGGVIVASSETSNEAFTSPHHRCNRCWPDSSTWPVSATLRGIYLQNQAI